MGIAIPHKVVPIHIVYRNDNLLSGWTFSCYVNMRLRFAIALDYLLDIIDIISIKSGEGFLDFKDAFCVTSAFGGLCV